MIERYSKQIVFLVAIVVASFCYSPNATAANVGEIVNFNVDPNYDATARSQVQATLVKATGSLYFYVEKSWWDLQTFAQQNTIASDVDILSSEFASKIYPTLTSVYGSEWNPGIDNDSKITLLFESINNNLGGYFRTQDEYSKLLTPDSNQREMVYLPITKIDSNQLKVFLAHEFVHLIVFNQKDRLLGVSEEMWLSEARSDYASTILGYDDALDGSNLQRRVSDFLDQPGDSLTEWKNTKYDYAVESLFMHYLVDYYGVQILTDSLKSKLVGIPSINEALLKAGAKEDFARIFTNWTISVVINNCFSGTKYCYLNQNLSNLKISPSLIFLPLTGNSSLSMDNITKNWAGNWEKIIGGNGDLKLEFSSVAGLNFQVPYIIYDKNNNYTVQFLKLDSKEKGEINIKDFGKAYNSLVILPSLQTRLAGFDGPQPTHPYNLTILITGVLPQSNSAPLQSPLVRFSCTQLNNNLYMGVANKSDVMCLQQFLKAQGQDVYPEGLVTGYFGNLTKLAVIRFQEKYRTEILTPIGLLKGTGFVGVLTRTKINSLL
jgi:hypothetical protein